ncbi:MAG: two-component system sensor histidine kinase NtrB [Acidimicrobiales bacterium]
MSIPSMTDDVYRDLLELHAHVVFAVDEHCRFIGLNPGWLDLSGCSVQSTLGVALGDVLHCDRAEDGGATTVDDLLASCRHTRRLRRHDGTVRTVEVTARPGQSPDGEVAAVGTITDVTARDHDEVQLRHSQKLEAVGRLAAGIAHEINTPIQFIGDNLNFLSESFERVVELLDRYRSALNGDHGHLSWDERQQMLRSAEDQADIEFVTSEVPEAVASALDGAHRVASIVRAMKAFDHPDRAEPQPVDLNEVIANTLIVARNELKYVADVETRLGEVPTLAANPGDLGQVFLNLFVNAADAIGQVVAPTGGRGTVTVTSEVVENTAVVTVADTGGGIPDEVGDRIFEPFFTTKEVGKGTGQGLPLAQALLARHRGRIWFETEPGAGTTFIVTLPVETADEHRRR